MEKQAVSDKGRITMINITPDPKDPYAHYPAAYEAKSKNTTAFRLNYALTAMAAIGSVSLGHISIGSYLNISPIIAAAVTVFGCLAAMKKKWAVTASLVTAVAAITATMLGSDDTLSAVTAFVLYIGCAAYDISLYRRIDDRAELKKLPGWPTFIDNRPQITKNGRANLPQPAKSYKIAPRKPLPAGGMQSVRANASALPNNTGGGRNVYMPGVYDEPSLETPVYHEKPKPEKRTRVSLRLRGRKHSDQEGEYTYADAYNLEAAKELSDIPEDMTDNIEMYLGHLLPDYTNYDTEPKFEAENKNIRIIEKVD